MATIDYILDDKTSTPQSGTSGTTTAETEQAQKKVDAPAPAGEAQKTQTDNSTESFAEQYRKSNPFTPKTDEELEKEKKKEKREKMFAAIGDGIAAISNLYFATKGAPSMYDGKNTMSEKTQVRYDRMKKEYEDKKAAYFNGLMKARAADAAVAKEKQADREWQRKLGLDQEKRDQQEKETEHRKEREKIADDRYDKEQAQKAEERKMKQQQRAEDNARKDRDYNLKVRQHNDNKSLQEKRVNATAARGVRGKRIGFSDGGDNNIGVYENVWKGSMQSIFDTLRGELLADLSDTRVNNKYDTPQKKEDFVKQNWWKSEAAKAQMRALSKLDPSLMTAEDNDEIIDYVPGGGSSSDDEEEIIDYVPGKK